jgi:hypothetical protein
VSKQASLTTINNNNNNDDDDDPNSIPADYAQKWVKVELLAVRQPWWGQKVGSLLLACAMYEAWRRNQKRTVLHVAGGTSNVAAVKLYQRFGFVPASGLFHKPDRDIYVLGNMELALQSLLWDETLLLRPPVVEKPSSTKPTTTSMIEAK